ncbi:MAG: hypothetical protein Q8L55_08065 [Phycisphaerales bacterium]|nr:hypothetical protein [Phycisphaerales bacterium]
MGLWFSYVVIVSLLGVWRVRRVSRTVTTPICAGCRYSLVGLSSDALCPECGSPFRQRHRISRRTYILPVLGRLPLIWLIFLVVPPMWAYANLIGTTVRYARVEGFRAGWRNASVAFGEQITFWDYYELLAPCVLCTALASIFWPRRARWLIAAGLFLFLGWTSWHSVNSWHRHDYFVRHLPVGFLLLFAMCSTTFRAVYLYFRSVRARNRLSRQPWRPQPSPTVHRGTPTDVCAAVNNPAVPESSR